MFGFDFTHSRSYIDRINQEIHNGIIEIKMRRHLPIEWSPLHTKRMKTKKRKKKSTTTKTTTKSKHIPFPASIKVPNTGEGTR